MDLNTGISKFNMSKFNHQIKKISDTGKNTEKNTEVDKDLREATHEFESLFIHNLLKTMRAAIPKSEFFNGGSGEEIFTDLLDQEISKDVSKRGIGIAAVLYQRLTKS